MPGVKRFEELDVHKLAVQLRKDVVRMTSTGTVVRDFKFVAQIRDAARGGPRNIAEGFARGAPLEFRKFLGFAKASIAETKNHIDDARENGYFKADDCDHMLGVARRTMAGITSLMRYLETPAAQEAYERMRREHQAGHQSRSNTKMPATEEP
jgi:four helix bundle protein